MFDSLADWMTIPLLQARSPRPSPRAKEDAATDGGVPNKLRITTDNAFFPAVPYSDKNVTRVKRHGFRFSVLLKLWWIHDAMEKKEWISKTEHEWVLVDLDEARKYTEFTRAGSTTTTTRHERPSGRCAGCSLRP